MTLGWVITGTIGQVLLAYMLFLLSVFGFSAVCNTHRTSRFDVSVLNSALYAVPASCLLSAVVVIGLYRAGSGGIAYLWYAAPVLLFSGYWLYAKLFIRSH